MTVIGLDYVTVECSTCGTFFGLRPLYREKRVDDHATFYCPNGHAQHFPGKSEAERLRDLVRQADIDKTRLTNERDAARIERDAAKKKLNRIAVRGVCPCCKRSFVALRKHMQTKHPEWKA